MLRPSGATTCTQLSPENRSDNAGAAAWRCGSEAIEATTVDGSVEAGFDRSALAASWSAGRSSGAASWMPAMCDWVATQTGRRSEEHTSELQSLMRISYAVFCLKKKN